jgi:hypothetical protein
MVLAIRFPVLIPLGTPMAGDMLVQMELLALNNVSKVVESLSIFLILIPANFLILTVMALPIIKTLT